jgi:hypothetical protein
MLEERFPAGEGSVEYIDIETLPSQVRAKIQNSQRGIRLHDLKLFRVFVKKVTVCQ